MSPHSLSPSFFGLFLTLALLGLMELPFPNFVFAGEEDGGSMPPSQRGQKRQLVDTGPQLLTKRAKPDTNTPEPAGKEAGPVMTIVNPDCYSKMREDLSKSFAEWGFSFLPKGTAVEKKKGDLWTSGSAESDDEIDRRLRDKSGRSFTSLRPMLTVRQAMSKQKRVGHVTFAHVSRPGKEFRRLFSVCDCKRRSLDFISSESDNGASLIVTCALDTRRERLGQLCHWCRSEAKHKAAKAKAAAGEAAASARLEENRQREVTEAVPSLIRKRTKTVEKSEAAGAGPRLTVVDPDVLASRARESGFVVLHPLSKAGKQKGDAWSSGSAESDDEIDERLKAAARPFYGVLGQSFTSSRPSLTVRQARAKKKRMDRDFSTFAHPSWDGSEWRRFFKLCDCQRRSRDHILLKTAAAGSNSLVLTIKSELDTRKARLGGLCSDCRRLIRGEFLEGKLNRGGDDAVSAEVEKLVAELGKKFGPGLSHEEREQKIREEHRKQFAEEKDAELKAEAALEAERLRPYAIKKGWLEPPPDYCGYFDSDDEEAEDSDDEYYERWYDHDWGYQKLHACCKKAIEVDNDMEVLETFGGEMVDCQEPKCLARFWYSPQDQRFFRRKGWEPKKRCDVCIEKRKEERKLQLCVEHFRYGRCEKGDKCCFAHSRDEVEKMKEKKKAAEALAKEAAAVPIETKDDGPELAGEEDGATRARDSHTKRQQQVAVIPSTLTPGMRVTCRNEEVLKLKYRAWTIADVTDKHVFVQLADARCFGAENRKIRKRKFWKLYAPREWKTKKSAEAEAAVGGPAEEEAA